MVGKPYKSPVYFIKNFLTFFLTFQIIVIYLHKKVMTKEKLEELIAAGASRKCNVCCETLPVTDFYVKIDKTNKHCRFNSPCKSCANIGRNKNYQKAYHRKIKYNLTQEEYDLKLKKQNYSCGICGLHQDDYHKSFSVDHNHSTGAVRGLLCNNCNSGIGFFMENLTVIKKAIKYLKEYKI
jgi:hypothetical protein